MKQPSVFNRKGTSILISLFVVFSVFILLSATIFKQANSDYQNQINLLDRQAYFSSRSAMQHFMLKYKLFPTELYDAVEISQGKNPLFDFSEFPTVDRNGVEIFEKFNDNLYIRKDKKEINADGTPKYFYMKSQRNESFIRVASYYYPIYRFLAPNIAQESQSMKYSKPQKLEDDYKANKYLYYYYKDCSNYSASDILYFQPVMQVIKAYGINNHKDFDITKTDGYPYSIKYRVKEIKIKPIHGVKTFGEEEIDVVVEGKAVNFYNKESSQIHVHSLKIVGKKEFL